MSERSTITIRLDPTMHGAANAVAKHYGLNVAALFRMMITERARELGIEATKPKR